MNRSRYCQVLRDYVSHELSPTREKRAFVSEVYASINSVLNERNTIQIGSFRRFTAVTPLHDLDMLFIIGAWQGFNDPSEALGSLEHELSAKYAPPEGYDHTVSRQTHSITISLSSGGEDYFAVDVVPAYSNGINLYGDDMYMVPEIAQVSRLKRAEKYATLAKRGAAMGWIRSDPRGYNRAATEMNQTNEDFRRATKFVKGWRAFQKAQDDEFKLKSFHLEQLVYQHFSKYPDDDVFGAVFEVMRSLDRRLHRPQIQDRADSSRHIDDYVSELTTIQREKIRACRDGFMIALEDLEEDDCPASIIKAPPRYRASDSEEYLFDQGIPVLTEADLKVVGRVLRREQGSFRATILDLIGKISVDREIEFTVERDVPGTDLYKWKVKNDDQTSQPRGELTDHRTLRQPEYTKLRGNHFVECFAIRSGVCIARGRQNVVL